nr:metallophosphoesterase [Patescibacteria group bacterium]
SKPKHQKPSKPKHPIHSNKLRLTIFITIFATVSVFGISFITGNQQQSGVGNSQASAIEPADINNDNTVNVLDLSYMLGKWKTTDTLADLNQDGLVNVLDLSRLLAKWGPVATQPPVTTDTSFSFVTITDTQVQTMVTGGVFDQRMRWIANNKNTKDIRFVVQVGDLVNWDNCGPESQETDPATGKKRCNAQMRANHVYVAAPNYGDHWQYVNADKGLKIIEAANIPWMSTIGNHDTSAVGCGDLNSPNGGGSAITDCRSTYPQWGIPSDITVNQMLRNTITWNKFFPQSRYKNVDTIGFYESGKSDNNYQTLSAGGVKWMILNIELWPRQGAIDWAKSVVANHPDHNVIVNTHHYLNDGNTLSTSNGGYGNTSPQYLFDNLIKQYRNIRFVFSGHSGSFAFRTDTGVNGNKIYSILDHINDQNNDHTRVHEVDTANNTVSSKLIINTNNPTLTYSGRDINITNFDFVR